MRRSSLIKTSQPVPSPTMKTDKISFGNAGMDSLNNEQSKKIYPINFTSLLYTTITRYNKDPLQKPLRLYSYFLRAEQSFHSRVHKRPSDVSAPSFSREEASIARQTGAATHSLVAVLFLASEHQTPTPTFENLDHPSLLNAASIVAVLRFGCVAKANFSFLALGRAAASSVDSRLYEFFAFYAKSGTHCAFKEK